MNNNNVQGGGRAPFYQQFLLGSEFTDHLHHWKKTVLNNNLKLATHPDLDVTVVSSAEKSLILLGSILDTADPPATNVEVLNSLLNRFRDFDSLLTATTDCGGRWIIIAIQGDQCILFHDALGLRQVCYSDTARMDDLWVMSQPGIVADLFKLDISADAQAYIDSDEFRSNPEYRWPCAGTPFREIKQLLPNHYLDLVSGDSHRYWPSAPLKETSFHEALETLSKLLPALVTAAATRFDVVLGITAGLDSRLVLAASKHSGTPISGVSVRQNAMEDHHQDIAVPARLFNRLGLEHTVLLAKSQMSPEFAVRLRGNVFMAHDHYGPDAEAILEHYAHQKTVITGSGAEVGKCCYGEAFRNVAPGEVTGEMLSPLVNMGNSEYSTGHFNDWLSGLGHIHNIKVADLFQWEHAHGNWLAMTQLEFNFVWREIITPFNCRAVLTTLLSVPERYRKAPDYDLFLALIKRLWPELLSEPVNPGKKPKPLARLGSRLKNYLKSLCQVFRVKR